MNLLVARQLDTLASGNGAYLLMLLEAVQQAGLDVRVVFAPRRSFGNRPWMGLHPAFEDAFGAVEVPQSVRVGRAYWSLSPLVWGRFATRLVKEAMRRVGLGRYARVEKLLGDPLSAGEARELALVADRIPGDIVMAEYSSLGPVLELVKRQGRRAVFLHDLFSLRAAAFRARGEEPDHREITLADEAALVRSADLLVFASNNEMAELMPLAPKAACVWLRPNVPHPRTAEETPGPPRGVFIGTLHSGNVDAIGHLIDDIWPLVRNRVADAELWIAGSTSRGLTPQQAGAPGVKVLGRVEHLSMLGGPNSIGLAPTRLASGVSIKVAEYLRLGMPTVAYPVALEGFGPALDDLVDVTDTPQAFAERVVALINAPAGREQRSAKARQETPGRLDNAEVVSALRKLAGFAAH
jgi:hypothetical protein